MISTKRIDLCTGERPTANVAILTRKLTRDFVLGAAVVPAVRGVDFQIQRLDGLIEQDVVTERIA